MTKQAPTKPGTPDTIGGYLLPVLKALESRGVDAQNLIRQAGIDEEISSDPLARLPFDRLGEVFRLAVIATEDPRFGLYASRYMLPSHIHALGTALIASRSLMDVCRRIERFGSFLAQTVVFYVERDEVETKFGAHLNVPLNPQATDMFWSFVLRLMRHLDPTELDPIRVDLTENETPESNKAYSDFFHCPLSFGCQEMALYFDTERLERHLPTASEELAGMSDQVVKDYLSKLERGDIISRVTSLLVANLPSGDYSKEEAAGALNMSARTLQNKLREENTNWREVLDQTRYQLAVSYLESARYSLSEIAFMLGFNDTSSFSRAFRRWAGKPPGEYLPVR